MRYVDPAGLVRLNLPSGWAVDPMSSRLSHPVFEQWGREPARQMFLHLYPTMSRGTQRNWWDRVGQTLPVEVTRVELDGHREGLAWIERPGREQRPDQRWAILRGRLFDTTLEEVGVPRGGPLSTPSLRAAVDSLDVLANGATQVRPPGTWDALMDEADAAAAAGARESCVGLLRAAHRWAMTSWLASVQDGEPVLKYLLAAGNTCVSLAGAATDLGPLTEAADLVSLARPYAAADQVAAVGQLEDRVRTMCAMAGDRPAPPTMWQTRVEISRLAVQAAFDQAGQGSLARQRQRAELALCLGASGLLITERMAGRGHDAAEALALLRTRSLEMLVAAGAAFQVSLWHAAALPPEGFAQDWLLACRMLAADSPGPQARDGLVMALVTAAGAGTRIGDELSGLEAEALLGEARILLGDQGSGGSDQLNDQVWLSSSWVSLTLGRPDEALRRSEQIRKRSGHMGGSYHSVRATALRALGRYEEALASAQAALGPDDPSESTHRLALALALSDVTDRDQAIDQARLALAAALTENPVGGPVTRALILLSHLYQGADERLSIQLAVLAQGLVDLQAHSLGDGHEVARFDDIPNNVLLAADLADRLLSAGAPDAALSVAEHARARTERVGFRVVDDLETPRIAEVGPNAPLPDLVHLLGPYLMAESVRRGLPRQIPGDELRALVDSSGRTTLLLHPSGNRLLRFLLRPGHPVTASVVEVDGDSLAEQTVALHHRVGSELLLRAADRISRTAEDDEILAGLNAWAAQGSTTITTPEAGLGADPRRTLHDLIVGGLDVADGEPLVVVPYRELALVPFPILLGPDHTPLLLAHPMSTVSSLSTWLGGPPRRPANGPRRAVVVGDPQTDPRLELPQLQHAAAEAQLISALLATACTVRGPLIGEDAAESEFRRLARGAGILHLACHAAVGASVMDSALYLAAGGDDDGTFGVLDAESLQLDDALVVLAACQTGLGRATPDGVAGLGQAFRRAGARCVVLSLWRVGDISTSFLMEQFYRALLGSVDLPATDVATAMALAQRRTREVHPSVDQWGPWLVTGDGGWRIEQG